MQIKHLPKRSLVETHPKIKVSGSKSEANRLLILQKLYPDIEIKNLSDAQDTQLLHQALLTEDTLVDIHHAGTAMRFLTAYFSIQEGRTTILTGSARMKQRPIAPLVSALRSLGAEIGYLENEGFPPLRIVGKKLSGTEVSLPAHISSQFITALLLIGARLEQGLKVHLLGTLTSRPYLEMTLSLLSKLGIKNSFQNDTICIAPYQNKPTNTIFEIESDWSSASYFYSMVAIGRQPMTLSTYKQQSLQGDAALVSIYQKYFGVETHFDIQNQIILVPRTNFSLPEHIELYMNDCPDIAQTVAVTAAALQVPFRLTGLETLKVKETDRLVALYRELKKLGVQTEISLDSIRSLKFGQAQALPQIETYQDHRMAMSFAPYALVHPLAIEDPKVVEKSYPQFWKDFHKVTQEG